MDTKGDGFTQRKDVPPEAVLQNGHRTSSFTARLLDQAGLDEVEPYFGLRHAYFVRARGWASPDPAFPGTERDRYDAHCHHLTVATDRNAVAYLRVLPHSAGAGFMLDREFRCLVDDPQREALRHEGSVELSRLVCAPDIGPDVDGFHPVEHLLKLLYGVSLQRGYWRFTIVVEEAWLRPFARRFGLPFRTIGGPMTFPDGTRTVAATATLDELEAGMKCHSKTKYEWYRQAPAQEG